MPRQTQNQVPAPANLNGASLSVSIPASITIKDVVVIVTALITIVSSWTFYTMRLSVQEQKIVEYKVQMEKVQTDFDSIHKDIQDLKLKIQALEIRQTIRGK